MSGERQCILVPMMRRALFLALACSFGACSSDPTSGTDVGVDGGGVDGARVDAARPCSVDADCDDARYCNGRETCVSGTCRAGTAIQCDDGIACTVDECVEARQTCHSAPPDADHDGSLDASCHDTLGVPLGDDCLDSDPNRYPGNHEICDAAGHDEDCNLTTVGTTDMDLDGYVSNTCCNTGGLCGPDCDDTMLNRHPMAPELCNGLDDDCDMIIDEGLAAVGYYPDCDSDGYGDLSATPVMTCTVPPMPPCTAGGGQWVMQAGDCADHDPMRHMGATEACNGVDDDCDAMIDDIIHGTVVCAAGQTRSCHNASCGTDGVEACAATCLAWSGRCVATEICNGCDDDNDGAPDNGFTCARGSSQACTVAACGSPGTQVCDATCGWGSCTGAEICNYCDDNGNGNFNEERPTAVATASDHPTDCTSGPYASFGPAARCDFSGTASDISSWETLLDGTSTNQAGAFWWSPSNLTQGWGTTEVQVDMEVTGYTANAGAMHVDAPLGGWSVIVARSGTPGVGTPQNRGIPLTVTGVAASWYWSVFDCMGHPPNATGGAINASRFTPIRGGGIVTTITPVGMPGAGCTGENVGGGVLSGPGSAIVQHITLRYTPDDPTVAGNQEQVQILAGSGATLSTNTYVPSSEIPVGSAPLRIGITAGTYAQGGFIGPPPGWTYGIPVRARFRVLETRIVATLPPIVTVGVPVTRAGLCP